jgi:hypothetical protein
VAGAVAVVAGSGVALDRGLGPRAAGAGEASGPLTGAWFCPHGGFPGWQGWIVLANPGATIVRVRLTELSAGQPGASESFSVPPLQEVYREVSATEPADATVLEYFGGWIGAAAVVRSGFPPRGVTAQPCESSPRRTWYLLDEPTGPGETSLVVVMNPFSEDAAFDLVARTEQRTIAPGTLRPYVLPARTSVAFRLNDIALEGPGERTVTVTVTARVGRVVAGGAVSSSQGARLSTGAPFARVSDLPAGGGAGSGELVLANPGLNRADLSVIASGRTAQRLLSGPNGISLAAGEVRTIDLQGLAAATIVQSDNAQSLCAIVRVRGAGGQKTSVTGGPGPARQWLVLPALSPKGGRSFLVVHNPGRSRVRIAVQFLGTSGVLAESRLGAISLPPGRTFTVRIRGSRPAAVVLRSHGGSVVVGAASHPADGGYAAMLALPM